MDKVLRLRRKLLKWSRAIDVLRERLEKISKEIDAEYYKLESKEDREKRLKGGGYL